MSRRSLATVVLALAVPACTTVLGIDGDYVVGDASTQGEGGGVDASKNDGGDAGGDGSTIGDGSPGDDAGDSGGGDAGCNGHICNGVCLAGGSCADCTTAKLFCASSRACVSACGSCGGQPVECWACPSGGAAQGSCEPSATAYCLGGGYDHCACAGGLTECPAGTQTCSSGGQCLQCGESGSDGRACKAGKTCDQAKKACN